MKKVIIGIIIGILVSSIVAYAGVVLSSDKVGYKDATVKDSLDDLFDESVNGKISIVNSLSSNGLDLNNSSTYSEIVDGINDTFNDISNGKNLIAEAVTNKGVETLSTDSYDKIASNISSILTKKTAKVYPTNYYSVDWNGWFNINYLFDPQFNGEFLFIIHGRGTIAMGFEPYVDNGTLIPLVRCGNDVTGIYLFKTNSTTYDYQVTKLYFSFYNVEQLDLSIIYFQ